MALSDFPTVDLPSANSETSERALGNFLNQHSGFICRLDKPDKGCDFDVELMINGSSAVNQRFGIQLKSVEKLPLLADGVTISYAFETSRLGYLLNRPIGEGLIVLYDVYGKALYYEYAVTLHGRLTKERGSSDWEELDTVKIHIPLNNIINEEAAIKIHAHFQMRFEAAAFLIASQGSRYGLSVAKPTAGQKYDIKNPEQVKEILLKHGMGLLYEHDIELCFNLIRQLPAADIDSSSELLVMAAIAYGEMGRRYDSENFIRKLNKVKQVPAAHKQMIRFGHLKNQMMLEQIDLAEFVAGIKAIRDEESSPRNILLIDLNIIFYELLSLKFFHKLPDDMLKRIRSVFVHIKELSIDDRSRQLIEANNAENLSQYILFLWSDFFNELAIQRAAGTAERSAIPALAQTPLLDLESELNKILEHLYTEGQAQKDELLQAHALLVQSRYLTAKEISLISQWPMLKSLHFHNQKQYVEHIKLALSGHDHFMAVGYVELAYQSLVNGIELILIGRDVYKYRDEMNLPLLESLKLKMEQQHELEALDQRFPQLTAKITRTSDLYMSDTRDMDDQQLEGMASSIFRALKLPYGCHANLLNELRNCRTFYQRGSDKLELIPYEFNHDLRLFYSGPVRFIIRNKQTNFRSVPSSDVGALLDSWGVS
ncbi:DUF4365 domain-containing protein [Mucilaginibacter sp. RCC_168]|uniref:DUF4365 domain-containing protein n=1 Tax=Mucilaginibacter sp. RCC_168 TaxID=3239221 RepID=UPI003524CCFA